MGLTEKEQLLEDLLEGYSLEKNDRKTRNELAESISNIMGFLFTDQTTLEMIDDGFVVLDGFNPEIKKIMRITIQPDK